MLLDAQQFRFSAELQRRFATFHDEFSRLEREHFLEWPDRAAYGGKWLVAPLFMSSHIEGIEGCFERNQALCPQSTAALRAMPGVTAAAFSWMEPNCHIYAHKDVKAIDVLRAHLPLEVPQGAAFRVGDDLHEWHRGESLLFDGYVDHETGNRGNQRRVVLLVDAVLAPHEFEQLSRWRSEHGVDVDPSLVLVDPHSRETVAPGPRARPSEPVRPVEPVLS